MLGSRDQSALLPASVLVEPTRPDEDLALSGMIGGTDNIAFSTRSMVEFGRQGRLICEVQHTGAQPLVL